MRKALFIILTLGSLMSMLACSSDKNQVKTEGDPNDPSYVLARGYTTAYVDSLSSFVADGYSYMSFDGTRPQKTLGDSVDIHFDDSNFWWEIYAHHDSTGFNVTFRDSVRFEEGDGYQILPDSQTTTGLEYRASADVSLSDDSTDIGGVLAENFHAGGIQSEQVVFNGGNSADVSVLHPPYTYGQNYDGAMTNVTFNRADLENEPNPHPLSGAIALSMLLESSSPQGSSSVNWNIGITFYVDHYHIHFESGDNYWDLDVQYGG
jgi:hypothetical protein